MGESHHRDRPEQPGDEPRRGAGSEVFRAQRSTHRWSAEPDRGRDSQLRSVPELLDPRHRVYAPRCGAEIGRWRIGGPGAALRAVSRARMVIGFGNPLRRDDAIGWRAAELIEARLSNDETEVSVCHQLTPDLAAKIAGAAFVVFLDADVE